MWQPRVHGWLVSCIPRLLLSPVARIGVALAVPLGATPVMLLDALLDHDLSFLEDAPVLAKASGICMAWWDAMDDALFQFPMVLIALGHLDVAARPASQALRGGFRTWS